ncbi:hypothetical protein AB0392_04045 [Nonomuraea angiospora]|uniref:hypothetical protein n=1 Tax=Nonomuraea angiospora TaxID=46172 RepID=UPI0034503B7B
MVRLLEVFSLRNGVRHLLGAGAGLLATPLIATGFIVGVARYRQTAAMTVDWVVLGVIPGRFPRGASC